MELATDIFEMPVRVGTPVGAGGLIEEYSSPVYATAVGLVMSAAQRGEGRELGHRAREHGKNIFSKLKDWFQEFF
jgi:cell division protein FtsA